MYLTTDKEDADALLYDTMKYVRHANSIDLSHQSEVLTERALSGGRAHDEFRWGVEELANQILIRDCSARTEALLRLHYAHEGPDEAKMRDLKEQRPEPLKDLWWSSRRTYKEAVVVARGEFWGAWRVRVQQVSGMDWIGAVRETLGM